MLQEIGFFQRRPTSKRFSTVGKSCSMPFCWWHSAGKKTTMQGSGLDTTNGFCKEAESCSSFFFPNLATPNQPAVKNCLNLCKRFFPLKLLQPPKTDQSFFNSSRSRFLLFRLRLSSLPCLHGYRLHTTVCRHSKTSL